LFRSAIVGALGQTEAVELHNLVTQFAALLEAAVDAPLGTVNGGASAPEVHVVAGVGEQLTAVAEAAQHDGVAAVMAVGELLVGLDPLTDEGVEGCGGECAATAARVDIVHGQDSTAVDARREGDDGQVVVAVGGLDLVDVCELMLGLEARRQTEAPAQGDGVVEIALEVVGRVEVGLDLYALAVEALAAVVVYVGVDAEDEDEMAEGGVKGLDDVRAVVRIGAVRCLRLGSEGVLDEGIGIGAAVCREHDLRAKTDGREQEREKEKTTAHT